MSNKDDIALLAELGLEPAPQKVEKVDAKTQRVISGFKEIKQWVAKHGRVPENLEDRDIFERIYAVRLAAIKSVPTYVDLLALYDTAGLLTESPALQAQEPEPEDDYALLAALGLEAQSSEQADITALRHVRTRAEIKAADKVAERKPCEDFEGFESQFALVKTELDNGRRQSRRFERRADVRVGEFFILKGQLLLVASEGEWFTTSYGSKDRRLRVIYDDGSESDLLLRSLQRALYGDEHGRRVIVVDHGALFAEDESIEGDAAGTIYVLKSLSQDPALLPYRDVLVKIGVTTTDLAERLSGAEKQATYLLAQVDVIATFEVFNIDPVKLEALLHRFFADAQFKMSLPDRMGNQYTPREWFLLPVSVIKQAIELIESGWLHRYRFDVATLTIVERG